MYTQVVFEEEDKGLPFAMDDRLFLGEALFETLKVENGKPCLAYLHWQRLSNSAQQVGIPFVLPYDTWLQYLLQKIQQDNLSYGGIKAILSGGSAPRGLAEQGQSSLLRLHTFKRKEATHPLRLVRAPWVRDAANPVYQVKSINYLEAILVHRQALALKADDALFFNLQQHATETTCANLFLIQNDTLLTPPLVDGVLPGIVRSIILSLSKQLGISCRESSLTYTMIQEADAVFTTNSLQGIRVVLSLDGFDFAVEHPLIMDLKSSFESYSH